MAFVQADDDVGTDTAFEGLTSSLLLRLLQAAASKEVRMFHSTCWDTPCDVYD
jgi:hypothetical protein